MSKELHTEKLRAGGRTYYFDVRETEGGNKYLHIKESRFDQGRKVAHDIIVFIDHVDEFLSAIDKSAKILRGD